MFNIETTNEFKAIKELQVMDQYSSDALNQFKMYIKNAHDIFWFGEISPKIKIQLLGTKAGEVFQAQQRAESFILQEDPTYEPLGIPNGYAISWNEDQSATITGEYIEENVENV